MKHNVKITIILLAMFIVTQFIGLYVVDHYSKIKVVDGQIQNVSAPNLPFGFETPEVETEGEFAGIFISIIIAFVFAIFLLFILMKFKSEFILRLWFFIVVIIALGISFTSFLDWFQYASIMALVLAVPLAFIKIYRQEFLVHNFTELLIYPGIAAVFVPILNIYTIIALLIIISIYDAWAVWHSGIMQKMAKYQIQKLNVFSGFFLPYASGKIKAKIANFKQDVKDGKMKKEDFVKKKFKVNVAILGGGDVIFPIIAAGVMMKTPHFGFVGALFVIAGATLGLSYLFFFAEKRKFYPAMPFITVGIFLGMVLGWLIL